MGICPSSISPPPQHAVTVARFLSTLWAIQQIIFFGINCEKNAYIRTCFNILIPVLSIFYYFAP